MSSPALIGEGPSVPEAVLRGLREVDPRADCLWLPRRGHGYCYEVGVWTGEREPNKKAARMIFAKEAEKPAKYKNKGMLLRARHFMKGWRPVFRINGIPDQRDVEEFRRRDYNYRVDFAGQLAQRERDGERLDQKKELDDQFSDHIRQFCVEEYPYISRCRSQAPFHETADRSGTRWRKNAED